MANTKSMERKENNMNFKEQLESLKDGIKAFMTNDLPVEKVNELGELVKKVDGIGEEHQKLEDAHSELKDRYIDSVKHYGTSDKPVEEDQQPKSFEQILSELEENSKKG